MKQLILAAAAVVALAGGSASAADLARRMPRAVPAPVAPVFSWTGWYFGANVGYSWGRVENDLSLTSGSLGGTWLGAERQNVDGVIAGVQSGINWQAGIWVIGLESDIQWSGQEGDSTFCVFNCSLPLLARVDFFGDHKLNWFGTSRTRIGFLLGDFALLYGTAGIAYGQVEANYTINAGTTPFAVVNFEDTRAGWTAGAGIEGAFGGGWSAKLEYLYIDLGERTFTATTTTGAAFSWNQQFTDHIVRVGLNFKGGLFGLVR